MSEAHSADVTQYSRALPNQTRLDKAPKFYAKRLLSWYTNRVY